MTVSTILNLRLKTNINCIAVKLSMKKKLIDLNFLNLGWHYSNFFCVANP